MDYWTERQATIFEERLDHVKFRKGTRFWDGTTTEVKAADPSYVVNLSQWTTEVTNSIMASLRREIRKMINDELDWFNSKRMGKPFDIRNFVEQATLSTERMVYQAAQRQTQRVIDRISELDQEGESLNAIKREVRKMLDKRGSWNQQLAIYAVTSGVETARNELWKTYGDLLEKTWVTEGDEKVRASHRAVDGTTVSASMDFVVGGFPMIGPGDPRAPIHETANCRCWTEIAIKEI